MSSFKPISVYSAALVLMLCVSHSFAQQSTAAAPTNKDLLDEVIDEAKEKAGVDIGEASYNIENCKALIDAHDTKVESGGAGASNAVEESEVRELDLDKCRTLIK